MQKKKPWYSLNGNNQDHVCENLGRLTELPAGKGHGSAAAFASMCPSLIPNTRWGEKGTIEENAL